MIDGYREAIAYSLIGAVALVGIPWLVIARHRLKRRRLRQRGIKRYGH